MGQHFLASQPAPPPTIVEALGDISQATVLEIGRDVARSLRWLAARGRALIAST